MPISWRYTIGVGSSASAEEIETVKSIVKYFNAHPDMVQAAAQKVIDDALGGSVALARTKKEDVVSGRLPQAAIRDIDSRYAAASIPDDAHIDVKHIILLTTWIKNNFDQMNDPEKWVAWYKYLSPMKRGAFRPHQNPIETDRYSGSPDFGKPQAWDDKVREQMQALRAFSGTVRGYSGVQRSATQAAALGEPRDAGGPVVRNARGERMTESIEEQVARIDRLLSEAPVDIRLYKMQIDAKISADRIQKTKQLQDQLRGIKNVTTVTSVASEDSLYGQNVRFALKFTLVGQQPRQQFVEEVLIPAMNRVHGVEVTNELGTGWSMPVEVTTGKKIQESLVLQEYGFGGLVGSLAVQRPSSEKELPTPRPTLQSIVDDWAEGGVMAYDTPADSTDMRYTVMMPVDELTPFTGRYYRGDINDFEGRYQQFIKNGPTAPVYIAIGMNGRIKLTGNEDMVWFAKKSGLEEVPVFLSYQKQV
jgi:hypothetical protein